MHMADGTTVQYEYHGTVDWERGSASDARKLKKSKKKKTDPENYMNAESLAAAATELFAMKLCDDTNIGV